MLPRLLPDAPVLPIRVVRTGRGHCVARAIRLTARAELHLEAHGGTTASALERLSDLIVIVCSDPERFER